MRRRALRRLAELRHGPPPLWTPNAGAQSAAYDSQADYLFYGGAAGGGKTDLLLGLALTAHRKAIVFRREYAQLTEIVDRARTLIGPHGRYNGQDKIWRLQNHNRRLEFGAVQHPGDERKFQGRPHDLKAFDELTHFTEAQFRYLCGWLRTADPAQRCRVVGAGNPPTDAEGEWVIRFWAPWLDPAHPNPAAPGELRWFAMVDGEEVPRETGAPFDHRGETVTPKSRSFVPARVEDNPYYMATDYVATLQALPEPLRSMLREGRFDTAREDDPWQVLPTVWIQAAQDRWQDGGRAADGPRPRGGSRPPEGVMTAVGVDIAQGGSAETVLSPRWGPWFGEQKCYPGQDTPDGPAVAALVVATLRDGAQANIDVAGGWGGSAYDHLKTAGIAVMGLNGSERSDGRDRSGKLGIANKRAEWWWRFREALDPDWGEGLALPPDPRLRADLAAARWRLTARGIQIEDKAEIVKRLGRSPDRGEAAVYSLADESKSAARRRRRAGARLWTRSVRGFDPLRW